MTSRSDVAQLDACSLRIVDADKVAAVQRRMPPGRDVVDLADVSGLLAVPGRLRH